jgi:hypothetical protein
MQWHNCAPTVLMLEKMMAAFYPNYFKVHFAQCANEPTTGY